MDVVSLHNLTPEQVANQFQVLILSLHSYVLNCDNQAASYFIVCTPTRYGKLFPRLTNCPSRGRFDPSLPLGCPIPPPPPPEPLQPPTYGSPEPLITHIGAPLPPGATRYQRRLFYIIGPS